VDEPQQDEVRELLVAAGFTAPFRLVSLIGGMNNRVYRVESGSAKLLLKQYFRHPQDPRDRLGNEYSFSEFAWRRGLRNLAQPLARSSVAGLGLYNFLEGRPFTPADIGPETVRQAASFVVAINEHRCHPEAEGIPVAAEACFSLRRHLEVVEGRVARLANLAGNSPPHLAARELVSRELLPIWERVHAGFLARAAATGVNLDETLVDEQRCLSPSDFGFHNALQGTDGRVYFLDFEYAGWDDPAKLMCDYACQPKLAVSAAGSAEFTERVLSLYPKPGPRLRVDLLRNLYRIKWCCIMLNEFQPVGASRRVFACEGMDLERERFAQVDKVRTALRKLEEEE
jgi:hypothetical protein